MTEHQASYRQIMKATSLFGGVQVFNIIIGIIKNKLVALLMGTAGLGIIGLFTSAITLIGSIANLGLDISAVRNLSEDYGSGKINAIARTVKTIRRWVWITGFIGAILTIVFSGFLSEFTFGNRDYRLAFIWISLCIVFNQLSSGQSILLRGTRKLSQLAKATMLGSFAGLIIAAPLYYFYNVDGIVPSIIFSSLASLCVFWFYSRKVNLPEVEISFKDSFKDGIGMVRIGVMLMISGFLGTLVGYLLRAQINDLGGIEQVGLFTAGFLIIDSYTGMVFTAMGTDYFPRLSAVNKDTKKMITLMNHQAEIGLLILSPLLLILFSFIPLLITILYSRDFLEVTGMMQWVILGIFLKASSWPLAFSLLARADLKIFLLKEILSNIYYFAFSLVGYKLYGIEGLGMGFLMAYVFNLIQIFLITKIKYEFSFSKEYFRIFIPQLAMAILLFLFTRLLTGFIIYPLAILLALCSVSLSYYGLNKRINISEILRKFRLKK